MLAISQFVLPLFRISAMLMTMVFFGARFVPIRIRIYLSIVITIAVMGVLPTMENAPKLASFGGFLAIGQQIIIGVSMGLVTQFLAQTFVLLGQIIGMQSSLGFASLIDPTNGQNTPLLGQFFLFLATMLFITTDGHLQLLQLMVLSFTYLPIGESLTDANFYALVQWFGIMFKVAFNLALAGIIALLTINLTFGVMTRAAPQVNIFSLGFSFALIVGLLVSFYLLFGIQSQYLDHWQTALYSVCDLIRLDCRGGF